MNKTNIDWCDATLNPIVGCKNNCEYCYARALNKRFKFIENWNEPQLFLNRLEDLKTKKPKSIFMNSMSDINWWDNTAIRLISEASQKYNQHQYIFLTNGQNIKARAYNISNFMNIICYPNVFLGATITTQKQFINLTLNFDYHYFQFISIEPMTEPILLSPYLAHIKSIIVGAETGNRKDKILPEKQWILSLQQQCKDRGILFFMKDSLKPIMGEDYTKGELLWKLNKENKDG